MQPDFGSTNIESSRRARLRAATVLVLGALAAAVFLWAGAALAQDPAAAGLSAWKRGGCGACHGSFAEGGGGGERPAGPSLRKTRLTPEQLFETISCGRPGSLMPYNNSGAYAEVQCYGMPFGPVPGDLVSQGAALTSAEINDLVTYLMQWVVGAGPVSREDCGFYYGNPNNVACGGYR